MGSKRKWLRRHWAVLVVLVLGFALRMKLSPEEGYSGDIRAFQVWAKSAVTFGLAESYVRSSDSGMLPNYPPLSILIFAGTGKVYQLAYSPRLVLERKVYRKLIKVPAMMADVLTAALLYGWLVRRRVRRPWLGAAIYVAQPAVWYDSAVWGQVDSVYTLFLFAALVCVLDRRHAAFGALLACAMLCKAQTIVVVPLGAALALAAGSTAVLRATGAGLVVVGGVLAPFAWGGVLSAVKEAYTGSVGFYPTLSSAAYNVWWALYGDQANTISDVAPTWLGLSSRQLGTTMWAATVGYTLMVVVRHLRKAKELDEPLVFFAAALSAYGFFMLCAEMHERYLFPFVILGLPVAIAWRRFRFPYAVSTFLFFLNLLGPLSFTALDRRLYEMFPTLKVFIATIQTACFAVTLQRFGEYAREALAARVPLPPPARSSSLDGEEGGARALSPCALARSTEAVR